MGGTGTDVRSARQFDANTGDRVSLGATCAVAQDANTLQGYLYVINTSTNRLRKTLTVGPRASDVAVDTATDTVYVDYNDDSQMGLYIINGHDDRLVGNVKAPAPYESTELCRPIAVDPRRDLVYVAQRAEYQSVVFNGATRKVGKALPLVYATGIAVDGANNTVYGTGDITGGLAVMNGKTDAVTHYVHLPTFSNLPSDVVADTTTDTVIVSGNTASGPELDYLNARTGRLTELVLPAAYATAAGGLGVNTSDGKVYLPPTPPQAPTRCS